MKDEKNNIKHDSENIKQETESTKNEVKNIKHYSEKKKKVKPGNKFFGKKEIDIVNLEELEGKYKRSLADYQNLLKRTAEEKKEFAKYANEQIVMEILPVYDNLKESLKHISKDAQENAWAEGIKFVVKQFKDALANIGVQEIEAEGKNFDPTKMEAIEGKGESVKKVVKEGYELNGRVIVPARVVL
jgi:molecular chaperone GrpE